MRFEVFYNTLNPIVAVDSQEGSCNERLELIIQLSHHLCDSNAHNITIYFMHVLSDFMFSA